MSEEGVLRIGELRALQWVAVDLVARRIVVRRNLVHGKLGSPKGGKNREVDLCPSALQAFKSLRHLRGVLAQIEIGLIVERETGRLEVVDIARVAVTVEEQPNDMRRP